jgi:hypothetical protein
VFSPGQMAKGMKVHTLETKNKVLDGFIGQMEESIRDSGLKVSSMVRESTPIKMVRKGEASGKMEKDLTGSRRR